VAACGGLTRVSEKVGSGREVFGCVMKHTVRRVVAATVEVIVEQKTAYTGWDSGLARSIRTAVTLYSGVWTAASRCELVTRLRNTSGR
jgi:hypothetical protein